MTYQDKLQKRCEEDLVELLSRMGHPPQGTVKLVVQRLTSSKTWGIEAVPMTAAKSKGDSGRRHRPERSQSPEPGVYTTGEACRGDGPRHWRAPQLTRTWLVTWSRFHAAV